MKPLLALLLAGVLLAPGLVLAGRHPSERYDPHKSGHPLRVVGYFGHAVGMIVDTLIFRPAWWIAHYEPLYTLFGRHHNRVAVTEDEALLPPAVELPPEERGWEPEPEPGPESEFESVPEPDPLP